MKSYEALSVDVIDCRNGVYRVDSFRLLEDAPDGTWLELSDFALDVLACARARGAPIDDVETTTPLMRVMIVPVGGDRWRVIYLLGR